jgi:ankyrin repeat protein
VVKLLLGTGKVDLEARHTQYGQTPLSLACQNGHEAVVKLLLGTGKVDLNAKDTQYGQTPLYLACQNGHEAVVKLLLGTGKVDVDADAKDTRDGRTPLSWACQNGHEAVVKLLLLHCDKSTKCSKDNIGRTPLFYAAWKGHTEVLRLLLSNTVVSGNCLDYFSLNPLTVAVIHGREESVTFLATKGYNIDVKDACGRTPLWWARRTGGVSIENRLVEIAVRRGISISADTMMAKGFSNLSTSSAKYCDVCTRSVPKGDRHCRCGICNGGNFDICSECLGLGARCLDDSHALRPGNWN